MNVAPQSTPASPDAKTREPLALVVFGWVPWGRSWKRNQSMVAQLAERDLFERTVFINPRGMWLARHLWDSNKGTVPERFRQIFESLPRRHGRKIRICSQWHFIPFKSLWRGARSLEDQMFRRALRRYIGGRRFVLLNNHPNFYAREILMDLMDDALLRIFDLSDDFVEFFTNEEHRELFRKNIEYCCKNSDVVFAVNQHVAAKYGHLNPNTHVIPNSTNFDNFQREHYRTIPFLEELRETGGPILGCTGIINRIRIDYDLLEKVVDALPDAQFVFVGSADQSFIQLAARHRNVHHHRQVSYDELPDWIHAFDAAIIPFQVNEHTRGNDLLKFHDYLSMGKSVVCTNTGGAWKYGDLLHVAEGSDDFAQKIRDALAPVPDDLRERRIEMARQHSWPHRAGEIEAIIRQNLEAKPR